MNTIKKNILLTIISMITISAVACNDGICTIDNNSKTTIITTQPLQHRVIEFLKRNKVKIGAAISGTAVSAYAISKIVNSDAFQEKLTALYENETFQSLVAKSPSKRTISKVAIAAGIATALYGLLSQENEITEEGDEIITKNNAKTITAGIATSVIGAIVLAKSKE